MRFLWLAPLIAAALACANEQRSAPGGPDTRTVAETPEPAPRAALSETSATDDDGCDLDSTRAHPEPLALVREFVERDARGDFAKGGTWLSGAVRCPGHLPGPDSFMAIDTMDVLASAAVVRRDSAWVPVRYGLLGDASPMGFHPAPRVLVDTFLVERTTYGWRVVEPDMPMRIQARIAAEWDSILGDSLRAVLRSAAADARARRPANGR